MPQKEETWDEKLARTTNFDLTDKEKDWLNMLVEKAFSAPFDKMAVRHAMYRLYEKGKKDVTHAISQERERIAKEIEECKFQTDHSGFVVPMSSIEKALLNNDNE